jgi:hypothetical protein
VTSFKQFLAENNSGKEISISTAIVGIKNECSDFWNSVKPSYSKNKFMYRGIENMNDADAIVGTVRQDRKPKDLDVKVHNLMNEYFEKTFGSKFRSNTLFVTTDYSIASEYGTAYAIFPTDPVEAVWSPVTKDLYSDFFLTADAHILKALSKVVKMNDWLAAIKKYDLFTEEDAKWDAPESNSREFGTFKRAFNSYVDDMFFGPLKVQKKLNASFEKYLTEFFIPALQYQKGSVKEALENSEDEIMLICSKFYGIIVNSHDSIIDDAIGELNHANF